LASPKKIKLDRQTLHDLKRLECVRLTMIYCVCRHK